jgi:hypothetical protein
MARNATTAALSVKREDALAEHGHNPIDAVIHDAFGFPMDQYDRVLEVVQSNFSVDELVDGEQRRVGEVQYTEDEVVAVRVR